LNEKLQSRLGVLPGIESTGLVSILPLAPKSVASVHFTRPDQPPSKQENTPSTNYRIITPDYFRAMGIPLIAGRYFTEEDNGDRPPVVIVSSALAKNHFADRSPIGQRVVIDDNDAEPRSVEIIGVVGPVKQANLETLAQADMYLPLRQVHKDGVPWLRNTIYSVAKMNPQVGVASYNTDQMRATIRNVDPSIAVGGVRPMREVLDAALASRRFSLLLVGSFAAAALFLAAAGLYAVISYGIQQRTREIGVRLALGATRGRILKMIFKEGALLLGAGVAAGLAIALMLASLVANQMYGISEHDPFSFAIVSLLLGMILLLACWIASRRALNVDPVVALRYE
jgi:putative ABC transport system permease protein